LLEKGRSTGVSGRLLCHPEQRQALEDAEKEALEREAREKEQKGAPAEEKKGNTSLYLSLVYSSLCTPTYS